MDAHCAPKDFFTLPLPKMEGDWDRARKLPALALDCPYSADTVLEMWRSGAHVAVPLKVTLMEAGGGFVMLADALPLLVSRPEAREFQKIEIYRAVAFDVMRRIRGQVRDHDVTRLDPFVEPCGSALTGHATRACQRIVETMCPDWASGGVRAAWTTPRGSEQDFMGGTELVSLELTGARVASWEGCTLADQSAMLVSVEDASARRKEQAQALFEALGPTAVVARWETASSTWAESSEALWRRFVAQRESHLIGLTAQVGAHGSAQLNAQRL